MSLLDTASLIVTPNGYKEGKLYSVIPSDGSGDMSVVRATTATRVNSAGLVELVPYNIVNYSEQFDNVAWEATNASVTSNVIISPSGVQNADLLQSIDTNAPRIRQTTTQTGNNVFTFSCFAKKGNVNFLILRNIAVNVGGGSRAWFNLDTGVVGTVNSGLTASIESVGNGWYRCSISGTTDSSPLNLIDIALSATDNTFAGAASENIYLWGAQLVEGSTAKDYQKTETRLNIPRLDYSNGTCPSLLVEPQRTNLALYSSSFDNADWNKQNASVTANTTTSPDGTQNADSLIENGANDNHLIYQGGTLSAGSYSASVFIKKNTRQYAFLQIATDAAVNRYTIVVDLNNGTMTASSTSGAPSGTSYKIDSIGNGWYRLSVTATHTSAEVYSVFGLSNSGTPTFNSEAIPLYSGDGTSSAYFWGAQIEAGSYPTSYIPTTSASVTRNADAISKTGISSLIGQTEGVCFVDFIHNGADITTFQAALFVSSGDPSNLINIGVYDGRLNPAITASSVGIFDVYVGPNPLPQGRHKVAIAYKSGDFAIYLNGTQVYTNTNSATFGTMSQVDLGTILSLDRQLGDGINAAALWKTRLTNAECQTLTTI